MFLIAVYGGYFGAAAGVLLLALVLFATAEPLARGNAMRNLLVGLANATAAVAFVAIGPVRWSAVVPLAVGCLARRPARPDHRAPGPGGAAPGPDRLRRPRPGGPPGPGCVPLSRSVGCDRATAVLARRGLTEPLTSGQNRTQLGV